MTRRQKREPREILTRQALILLAGANLFAIGGLDRDRAMMTRRQSKRRKAIRILCMGFLTGWSVSWVCLWAWTGTRPGF